MRGDEVLREGGFLGFEGADLGLKGGDEGVELALLDASLLEALGEAVEMREVSERVKASRERGRTR